SVMPKYGFLATRDLQVGNPSASLTALYRVGVPYTKAQIDNAEADLKAQADPDADTSGLMTRYPKAQARDFDGDPARLTEMDALVAYLQMLGTLVDVNAAAAQEDLAKEKGR
ncbi:MAG TPA: cbb3-type cytochrome c oxidase subunit II, partial [Novosphingobium sp.]|nr:cbb3-type cytochrome c oxidase subunit II [Novosphingobium sp.]